MSIFSEAVSNSETMFRLKPDPCVYTLFTLCDKMGRIHKAMNTSTIVVSKKYTHIWLFELQAQLAIFGWNTVFTWKEEWQKN